MKKKINPAVFQRVAARNRCTFREAVRIAAAKGGRRSGQARRRMGDDQGQGTLL